MGGNDFEISAWKRDWLTNLFTFDIQAATRALVFACRPPARIRDPKGLSSVVRPWAGFFVLNEASPQKFLWRHGIFPIHPLLTAKDDTKSSPKNQRWGGIMLA